MNSVIGALRVVFGADTTGFDMAAANVEGVLANMMARFQEVERRIRQVGTRMTLGLTLPLGLMARSAEKGGGEFEAAMNGVRAALLDLKPEQLQALSKQARTLGPSVGRSAVEAANGIEALGLAGMSTADILNGGLASSLKLAALNGAEVADAGALANDVMAQFNLTAAQLPTMVDRITGSLAASKFGFDDYRLAAAQSGAVAGSLGMSFDEFNTAIAALSTRFASGSDAGTNFAAMIRAIVAPSDDAKQVMKVLGTEIGETGNIFLDAEGNMRSVADWAETLRTALARLPEGRRGEALTKLFGGDGMRAAIALMEKGRKGIDDLSASIAKANSDEKLAILQEGDLAASNRVASAFESLKIAIADTGLLAAFTAIKNGVAAVVQWLADLPPIVHQVAVGIGALTSVIGPLILATVTVGKHLILLRLASLGPLMLGIVALVNPIGVLITLLGRLAIAAGAMSLLGPMFARLVAFAGPIGAVVTVLGVLIAMMMRSRTASDQVNASTTALSGALGTYEDAVNRASIATGKNRDIALKNAAAKKEEARQVIATTQAKLAEARADLARLKAAAASAERAGQSAPYSDRRIEGVGRSRLAEGLKAQGEADVAAYEQGIRDAEKRLGDATAILDAASGPTPDPWNPDFDTPAKGRKDRTADNAARREELALEAQLEAARLRGDEAEAARLQDQLELNQQIAAYRDTELGAEDSRARAARDLAAIQEARRIDAEKQIADEEVAVELTWAQVTENHALEESLADQVELRRRIETYYALTKDHAEATRRAEEDMTRLAQAREIARRRWFERDAREREIDLARTRGDSEESIRALEQRAWIEDRARELEREGGLDHGEGLGRATAEAIENEKARVQGVWRDTIREGARAALDGDLKGFAKNWWRDQIVRGMEDALNRLSDLVQRLFSNINLGGGGGSGGGLGGLFGSLGKLLGIAGGGSLGGDIGSFDPGPLFPGGGIGGGLDFSGLPAFDKGGSFRVGGMAGIDKNVVSMRLSRGEMVEITPKNDVGPKGAMPSIAMHNDFRGADAGAVAALTAKLDRMQAELPGQILTTVNDGKLRGFVRGGRRG